MSGIFPILEYLAYILCILLSQWVVEYSNVVLINFKLRILKISQMNADLSVLSPNVLIIGTKVLQKECDFKTYQTFRILTNITSVFVTQVLGLHFFRYLYNSD